MRNPQPDRAREPAARIDSVEGKKRHAWLQVSCVTGWRLEIATTVFAKSLGTQFGVVSAYQRDDIAVGRLRGIRAYVELFR